MRLLFSLGRRVWSVCLVSMILRASRLVHCVGGVRHCDCDSATLHRLRDGRHVQGLRSYIKTEDTTGELELSCVECMKIRIYIR